MRVRVRENTQNISKVEYVDVLLSWKQFWFRFAVIKIAVLDYDPACTPCKDRSQNPMRILNIERYSGEYLVMSNSFLYFCTVQVYF